MGTDFAILVYSLGSMKDGLVPTIIVAWEKVSQTIQITVFPLKKCNKLYEFLTELDAYVTVSESE